MITGFVRGQALKVPAVYVAADTINYLTAQFLFQTSEWNGLEVWSHWEKSGVVYDIRLDDGRITEEMHLNLSAGAWRVYLHGNRYSDGEVVQRITTGVAVIEVQPTGTLDGEPFPEMPASVTEQILARLDDVEQNGGGSGGAYINNAEALYAAVSAGGVITIAPDADITVSQTLDLPEGTIILGNGAVIRRAAGFEKGLFNLSSGCHLENFTIDGNRSAMVDPTWNKTYEVNMKTDARSCVIENITINNGNEGIIVSGYDNIVRGCRLYNLGGNGIHFGSVYRCIAEDCTIIGANKSASVMENSRGCIYTCMYVEDVDIVNCYCEDGLAGVGGVDAPDNTRIKVTGCTVKNCTQAVEGETGAGGGATELIFSENQFVDCGNFYISDTGHDYPPVNKLVITGNIFTNTGIRLSGCRNTVISGNTIRGGFIRAEKCPYCLISGNIVDNPNENAMNIAFSPHISISGNSLRAPKRGVHAEDSEGILLFGNVFRQHPNSFGYDILKLIRCPESAVDNNKMYAYSGDGFSAGSNCRVMGNYIVVADSNMPAITVYGGNKNYIVAQNMSNGKFSIANGTDAVVQNNIEIESAAFKDVTYTLTNLTANGLSKILTDDDLEFTLTAEDGYTLPDTITVTMSGTALAAGTGYTYDRATGKVTVYRVSGAVEVTGGAV